PFSGRHRVDALAVEAEEDDVRLLDDDSELVLDAPERGLGPFALREIADEAGEHRRPGRGDPRDRELDREGGSVRAQRGDLHRTSQHSAIPGGDAVLQPLTVPVAEL